MTAIRPRIGRMAVATVLLALAVTPGPTGTSAQFSSPTATQVNTFSGAVFVPTSVPAPSVTALDGGLQVDWQKVEVTSGRPVTYEVTRHGSDGSQMSVCPASLQSTPILGVVRCLDAAGAAGVSYTYSVAPTVIRDGVTTWSRPTGAASVSVQVPGVRYGDIAVTSETTSNVTTTVQYPSGTQVGDILLLVVRNSKKRHVMITTNAAAWTSLYVNESTASSDSVEVFWSHADATGSVGINLGTTGSEATAAVIRYRRPANSSLPTIATASVVASQTSGQVTTFGAAGSVTTTAPYATVISIVSTVSTTAPAIAAAGSFVQRVSRTDVVSGTTFGLGVADQSGVTLGSVITSPTWTVSSSTKTWQALTVAFA